LPRELPSYVFPLASFDQFFFFPRPPPSLSLPLLLASLNIPLTSPPTQEQIGNLTGSTAWSSSGAEQKQAGIDEMKAAGEKREQDPQSHGYGKTEEIAGRLAGCEGMEKEGGASAKQS